MFVPMSRRDDVGQRGHGHGQTGHHHGDRQQHISIWCLPHRLNLPAPGQLIGTKVLWTIPERARSEAWKLLWSQNNLLSPATGSPILTPSQDIVLGWYYLTAIDLKHFFTNLFKLKKKKIQFNKIQKIKSFFKFQIFKKTYQVSQFYNKDYMFQHIPIWFYWRGPFELDKKYNPTLETRLNNCGDLMLFSYQFQFKYNWFGFKIGQLVLTTPGRVIVNDLVEVN